MNRLPAALALLLLCACAQEWRTEQPVNPTTYESASPRSSTSVGRLVRLAVLPAEVHLPPEMAAEADARQRAAELSAQLQQEVADYLAGEKGYDARPEKLRLPAPGTAQIRDAGARLPADGIVVIERWLRKAWATGDILGNLVMLNAPLFSALREPYFRVAIYEGASGRLAWEGVLTGQHPEHPVLAVPIASALGNLENAVPKQLRR